MKKIENNSGLLEIRVGGNNKMEVVFKPVNNTVWMDRNELCQLFGCYMKEIDQCIGEIFGKNMFRIEETCKYHTIAGGRRISYYIGIRETRHIECLYQTSDEDALYGKRFDDAIANGSYRLDIHHQDKPGLTFHYLDGTEVYARPGYPDQKGRWRKEMDVDPTFYQVPLRSIIPKKYNNLMVAGRMLDAAIIAYSGMRVMVNMNQLGEAAGVTSYLALHQNKKIKDVSAKEVREELKKGGSIII